MRVRSGLAVTTLSALLLAFLVVVQVQSTTATEQWVFYWTLIPGPVVVAVGLAIGTWMTGLESRSRRWLAGTQLATGAAACAANLNLLFGADPSIGGGFLFLLGFAVLIVVAIVSVVVVAQQAMRKPAAVS